MVFIVHTQSFQPGCYLLFSGHIFKIICIGRAGSLLWCASCGMWALSSMTGEWTCAPRIGRVLHPGPPGESPRQSSLPEVLFSENTADIPLVSGFQKRDQISPWIRREMDLLTLHPSGVLSLAAADGWSSTKVNTDVDSRMSVVSGGSSLFTLLNNFRWLNWPVKHFEGIRGLSFEREIKYSESSEKRLWSCS